ncbi:MAG: hypothetical protein HY904_25970 [Deltaproteobacteria bacterium]|nr:hypothetical protein [Deltaproteobacteria bacterium]
MILPSKHIPSRSSLLGVGGILLSRVNRPITATSLWEQVRGLPEVGTYYRFVLALDLLFLIGAIDLNDGLLKRTAP